MDRNNVVNPSKNSQRYQNTKPYEMNHNVCTDHPSRPVDEICCYCGKDEGKHREDFENQKQRPKIEDVLIRCGHGSEDNGKQCNHRMHLSCATFAKPMMNFNTQYLSLKQNNNAVWCSDHFCEICFGEGFQQTASCGELLHDKKTIRAFHTNCRPIGSKMLGGSKIELVKRPTNYTGDHMKLCGLCGKSGGKLQKCKSCIQSFHLRCHQTTSGSHDRLTTCRDCIFDVQIRANEKTFLLDQGVLEVVTTCKDSETNLPEGVVSVLSERHRRPINVQRNCLYTPPQEICHTVFKSWKQLYKDHKDLPAVSKFLQNLHEYWPVVQKPQKKVIESYDLHQSFVKFLKKNKQEVPDFKPKPAEENKLVKIKHFGQKGYGVVAKKTIKPGDEIGTYYGEVITIEERERRKTLSIISKDKEAKHYCFKAKIDYTVVNGAKRCNYKEDVIIDSSCYQNETA
ncbi:CRE-SET-8 protein [Caenorhabditis remanei]|uniref:CRE-SET-8 protein n=1 Tax=Caenorhabditis remanei TaxID=31234 RepID=E3MJH2_CAERE|nr:CRE-SET-8 protein [Caenorhabditis remanei]